MICHVEFSQVQNAVAIVRYSNPVNIHWKSRISIINKYYSLINKQGWLTNWFLQYLHVKIIVFICQFHLQSQSSNNYYLIIGKGVLLIWSLLLQLYMPENADWHNFFVLLLGHLDIMLILSLLWVTVFSTMWLLLRKWPRRDGIFRGNHEREYQKIFTHT